MVERYGVEQSSLDPEVQNILDILEDNPNAIEDIFGL